MTILASVSVIGGACSLLLLLLFISSALPINPIFVDCFQLRVQFKGPKNDRFDTFMMKRIIELNEPTIIINGIIYTTGVAAGIPQQDKIIKDLIRPDWFSEDPKFDTPEQQEIMEIWHEARAKKRARQWSSKEWCYVVEAAVAKNGIDVEARREHPNIWAPDQWPIPNQQ